MQRDLLLDGLHRDSVEAQQIIMDGWAANAARQCFKGAGLGKVGPNLSIAAFMASPSLGLLFSTSESLTSLTCSGFPNGVDVLRELETGTRRRRKGLSSSAAASQYVDGAQYHEYIRIPVLRRLRRAVNPLLPVLLCGGFAALVTLFAHANGTL